MGKKKYVLFYLTIQLQILLFRINPIEITDLKCFYHLNNLNDAFQLELKKNYFASQQAVIYVDNLFAYLLNILWVKISYLESLIFFRHADQTTPITLYAHRRMSSSQIIITLCQHNGLTNHLNCFHWWHTNIRYIILICFSMKSDDSSSDFRKFLLCRLWCFYQSDRLYASIHSNH